MKNIVISSTPLRISFIGGGTDFKEFYNKNNTYGQVISASINLRTYCLLKKKTKTIVDEKQGFFNNKINNSIIYESFKKFCKEQKIFDNYEIIFFSDIPNGSGLGTSSSFILSLIKSILRINKRLINNKKLINYANYFESVLMKRPIGMQDAWGSEIPGIKKIKFTKKKIHIKKILNKSFLRFVNNKLFLYPVNSYKNNKNLLGKIRANILSSKNINLLKKMNTLSNKAYSAIINEKYDVFLSALKESQSIKSSYANGIVNKSINKCFAYLDKKGLMPLKILGAGGRGFILFYCDNKKKLEEKKINYLDFKVVNS